MLLSKEILSELNPTHITGAGKIRLNDMPPISLGDFRMLIFNKFSITSKQEDEPTIVQEVKKYISDIKVEERVRGLGKEFNEVLNTLAPLVDITTGEVSFYSESSQKFSNLHEDVFMAYRGYKNRAAMIQDCTPCEFRFDPLQKESVIKEVRDVEGEIYVFNRYKTPKWLSSTPTTPLKLPERVKNLFENVFPDAETLEYVYSWIYHAYTGRNHVYLCMVGARGVGKTMVADLVGKLVGDRYYQKADDSMLDDKFNSQLENARLVFYDEINVNDPDKINKLKRFSNQVTSVQAKGKDTKTVRNFSSGMLANNYIDGLQIGPEERRFSIVSIGDKNLNNLLSESELSEMSKYLSSPEEDKPHQDIIDFGHWILDRYKVDGPPYSNSYVMKKEYFYRVSYGGLAQWKQFVLDYLTEMSELGDYSRLLLKDLKTEYKKQLGDSKATFPAAKTVSNFLYDYRHRDGIRVGEVYKTKDEDYRMCYAIRLNKDFIEWVKNNPNTNDDIKEGPEIEKDYEAELDNYSEAKAEDLL